MNKMSTMLGLIFFSSLLLNPNIAKADDDIAVGTLTSGSESFTISEAPCEGNLLTKDAYCIDASGEISIVTKVVSREPSLGGLIKGKNLNKFRPLHKKELASYLREKGITVAASGNVCTGGGVCAAGRTSGGSGSGSGRGRGDGDDNGGGGGVVRRGSADGGVRHTRYSPDPLVKAQKDYDDLNDFCTGLPDLIQDRDASVDDVNGQIKDIDINALQKAEKAAYAKMLAGCRRDCLKLATAVGGPCTIAPETLAQIVSKDDLADTTFFDVGAALGGGGDQNKLFTYVNKTTSVDATKVCAKVVAKDGCIEKDAKGSIVGNVGDCDASADWIAAFNALQDGKNKLAELKAQADKYAKKGYGDRSCVVNSASDVIKPQWKDCGSDCLHKALDSCPQALSDSYGDRQVAARTPYCADCGVNSRGGNSGGGGYNSRGGNSGGNSGGGGGSCGYGVCGGGISTAAQIIGALGGVVTPLGLGFMNMTMQNRNLAACQSMYAQQIQLSQNVGLPPTGPSCGGMGGMGGGFMSGGYNPMMMGMNPMMSMGMGMGYNPMMMGMGMNPMMGISGGLNFGMNPMMSMGMGYNPMMSMGGYNPMMMGGGYNPMMMGGMGMGGLPQSYNPNMGGPMGGMGMMGGYNPMMSGGYNPMMMGGMGGYGGMQSQMYNAQLQMSQNALQMAAAQNSMMNGYNNGANIYGMNGMYQSPMYGMNSYGYNPMSMYGGGYGGYNPMSMYGGYGGYNPMAMYGSPYGAGINFNAGLNIW